jgi:hypothetical protein
MRKYFPPLIVFVGTLVLGLYALNWDPSQIGYAIYNALALR